MFGVFNPSKRSKDIINKSTINRQNRYIYLQILDEFYEITQHYELGDAKQKLTDDMNSGFKGTIEYARNKYYNLVEDFLAQRKPDSLHAAAFKIDGNNLTIIPKLSDTGTVSFNKSDFKSAGDSRMKGGADNRRGRKVDFTKLKQISEQSVVRSTKLSCCEESILTGKNPANTIWV